jgi:hypothetical protein
MNSPNLLSALDLNTPRYRTRGSEFLRIGFHRTNYGVHEPMSAAMREFNEVIGLFDFILTRNQFVNRLKLTLRLPHDKWCIPHAVLCMVPVVCIYTRWACSSLHQLIDVTDIVHYFSFILYVFCICSFKNITKNCQLDISPLTKAK